MFRNIQELFIPASITDEEERSNVRLLVNIITVTLIISTLGFIALGLALNSTRIMIGMAIIALSNISGLIAIRLGGIQFARVITPLAGMTAIGGLLATSPTGVHDVVGITLAVIIVIATITLGRPGTVIFSFLSIAILSTLVVLEVNGVIVNGASATTVYDDIAVIALAGFAMMGVMNGLVGRLNDSLRKASETAIKQIEINTELRELQSTLEDRINARTAELDSSNQRNERRAKQFEAISQVARTISSTRDLDSLLVQITTVINREFGFYHVGIFLLDTAREYAVLSASNSDGGQRMLERSHRLKIGEVGMVGYVTSTGKPRVALDTGADAVFFNNPDLPETRSEIALPLRIGETIIGALDVQSTEPNAFNQEDVNILSTLADQVSIAIQNARQYEETRKALVEADTLSKQFVQTGWKRFSQTHEIEGIQHTGAKSTLLYRKKSRDKDESPSDKNQLKAKGRGAVLSLPVKLRGEVIGSVDVRSPENRKWDQDELDIVTAIIERAAIALESSRLLEDAQRRASREQAIGEISASISTFTDTEAILRATVNEIAQKIGGAKVVFELGTQAEDGKQSKPK